jgi:hypothetical protein
MQRTKIKFKKMVKKWGRGGNSTHGIITNYILVMDATHFGIMGKLGYEGY